MNLRPLAVLLAMAAMTAATSLPADAFGQTDRPNLVIIFARA